jgi:hypothetical protein
MKRTRVIDPDDDLKMHAVPQRTSIWWTSDKKGKPKKLEFYGVPHRFGFLTKILYSPEKTLQIFYWGSSHLRDYNEWHDRWITFWSDIEAPRTLGYLYFIDHAKTEWDLPREILQHIVGFVMPIAEKQGLLFMS